MIGKHRKCGCDCGDSKRWAKDPLIQPSTCYRGCGTDYAPCKFVANFECQTKCTSGISLAPITAGSTPSRGNPDYGVVLRPACVFSDPGRYVSVGDNTENLNRTTAFDACDWATRIYGYRAGGLGFPAQTDTGPMLWIQDNTNWVLRIDQTPVTMTHKNGIIYEQKAGEAWDCFGPNTLNLKNPELAKSLCPTVPSFVCITPAVKVIPNPKDFCTNCFYIDLPEVVFAGRTDGSRVVPQKIEFLESYYERSRDSFNDVFDPVKYVADVIVHENTNFGTHRGGTVVTKIPALLSCKTPMESGQPGIAELRFKRASQTIRYTCENFTCNGGYFANSAGGSTEWPGTLFVSPQPCVRHEQYDEGPKIECQGSRAFYDDTVTYSNDLARCACCDPWGECMPGSFVYYCGTSLTPLGVTPTCPGFCVGGRTGVSSPVGPSREWCVTVPANGGGTHTICMVAYCSGSGGWKVDWYCNGTFQGTTTATYTCCPMTAIAPMPSMSCMPECTGCVGINTLAVCSPPPAEAPCCDTESLPSTLTAHLVSTCLGTFDITLTRTIDAGHVLWRGNAISPTDDDVLLLFRQDRDPCDLIAVCNDGVILGSLLSVTKVSCDPPSFTATWNYGTFTCYPSCGTSDVTLITIS